MEEQLNDLRGKLSNLEGGLGDSEPKNLKLQTESANLLKQLEDTEHKLGLATKQNKSLDAALSDASSLADEESKVTWHSIIFAWFSNKFGYNVKCIIAEYLN